MGRFKLSIERGIEEARRLGERARDRIVRWQYARIAQRLRDASPEQIARDAEEALLAAFHRAAREVPAYRAILARHGVEPRAITTLADFQRQVPLVDKASIFASHRLPQLCVGGDLEPAALFYSSSGHSGSFSFAVETRADAADGALAIEFALHNACRALDRRTLVINCLAMGVKVPTRTLPLIETGVRADVIWALVRQVGREFEQLILIGEHPFLKKVIDEGPAHGVSWQDQLVHVVTGGEYIAQSFRAYLADRLGSDGHDPDRGIVAVNCGLSELALSMLSECTETIQLRQAAQRDAALRRALCGRESSICPPVMQYVPQQTYLETVPGADGRAELVVSTLAPKRMLPLIRYNTQDELHLLSHDELAEILRQHRLERLIPPFRLPCGVMWGKHAALVTAEGARVYPEEVKEALYEDLEVAEAVTGNFRLEHADDKPRLRVQLRGGKPPAAELAARLQAQLARFASVELQLELLPYREFPHGFDHDFERKNQYL